MTQQYPQVGLDVITEKKPDEPTNAPPGSDEKLSVMAERAMRGESLFSADDQDHYEGYQGKFRPPTRNEGGRNRRLCDEVSELERRMVVLSERHAISED